MWWYNWRLIVTSVTISILLFIFSFSFYHVMIQLKIDYHFTNHIYLIIYLFLFQLSFTKQFHLHGFNSHFFMNMYTLWLFHFLFTVMDKNMQSIGHVAVSPSGVLSKYSNFIDRNKNKDFMPRFSKQIAYSSVIVPYQVGKRIGFALVEFWYRHNFFTFVTTNPHHRDWNFQSK